ncbi:MAG TPA: CYTH and CHAD domain-containing protein [Propionibacteriaceae bacterium]|nr:CYTH and CHAD domain-containing protein [Propionibacteriaceae bacterium]
MRTIKEQEDKFEVDQDWVMPPVADLVPDGGRLDHEVRKLHNTYFDTPSAGLRLFGITLRRRIGGSETGWQLKVPSGTARTELQSGSRAKSMPPALAKGVEGLRAGESLDPVATIVTTRTAYQLLNADDELVLEIADDQVESGPPDGESMLHSWREVEVELGPAGKKKDLKRATKMLLAAGAAPGTTRNKLDRALGPALPDGQASNIESGTVGELVAAYAAAQCEVLASNDVGMRTGTPAVHKTRVAARRLRSTLRIFSDVFDAAPAEELDNELKWYADVLGRVRDRDILSNRLAEQIAELPPEQVRGPVEAEVAKILDAERETAVRSLDRAMRTQRYKHLMQLLRAWRSAPPLTDAGAEEGATAIKYVEKATGRAEKRLRKAEDIEELHRARKAFKRARYAAELTEPADSQMKSVARDAEEMQTLLGEHQDATVAAKFLAKMSADGEIAAGSAFTYGILMANELNRATNIRRSLDSQVS